MGAEASRGLERIEGPQSAKRPPICIDHRARRLCLIIIFGCESCLARPAHLNQSPQLRRLLLTCGLSECASETKYFARALAIQSDGGQVGAWLARAQLASRIASRLFLVNICPRETGSRWSGCETSVWQERKNDTPQFCVAFRVEPKPRKLKIIIIIGRSRLWAAEARKDLEPDRSAEWSTVSLGSRRGTGGPPDGHEDTPRPMDL